MNERRSHKHPDRQTAGQIDYLNSNIDKRPRPVHIPVLYAQLQAISGEEQSIETKFESSTSRCNQLGLPHLTYLRMMKDLKYFPYIKLLLLLNHNTANLYYSSKNIFISILSPSSLKLPFKYNSVMQMK